MANSLKHDGEWWNGETGGKKGTFPGNFVSSSVLELVKAKYFFNGNREDELSFKRDNIIQVYEKKDNGWWRGIILDTDRAGLFPANHVQNLVDIAKAVKSPPVRYHPPKPKEVIPLVITPTILPPPAISPVAIANPSILPGQSFTIGKIGRGGSGASSPATSHAFVSAKPKLLDGDYNPFLSSKEWKRKY